MGMIRLYLLNMQHMPRLPFAQNHVYSPFTCGTSSKYPKLVNVTYIENQFTKAVVYIGY